MSWCTPSINPCCRGLRVLRWVALLGGLAALAVAGSAREAGRQDLVRVGIVDSLFRGIPQKTVDASAEPFQKLMEKETGRTGKMVQIGDAFDLARKLSRDEVELGVFYGYEYAWVKQKYPKLRPLAVAVNQEHRLYAYLVVRKDSGLGDVADLKGKSLAIPEYTKEYCLLFLDGLTGKPGAERKHYFSKLTKPANIEDALDDVVDREVKAALVDGVGLDRYRVRKPGRAAALQVLKRSAPFPPTVVAFHDGALDEATQRNFRSALLRAPDTADGRQVLTMWKLTGFERVPDDYGQQLEAILKVYPPPADRAK